MCYKILADAIRLITVTAYMHVVQNLSGQEQLDAALEHSSTSAPACLIGGCKTKKSGALFPKLTGFSATIERGT